MVTVVEWYPVEKFTKMSKRSLSDTPSMWGNDGTTNYGIQCNVHKLLVLGFQRRSHPNFDIKQLESLPMYVTFVNTRRTFKGMSRIQWIVSHIWQLWTTFIHVINTAVASCRMNVVLECRPPTMADCESNLLRKKSSSALTKVGMEQ